MRILTALRLFWNGWARNDEFARYILAEKASHFFYPEYRFSDFGRTFLKDEAFLSYFNSLVGTDNYHSIDRKFTLSQLMKLTDAVPGDTAECGVYQGASSYLICRHNARAGKKHHLFDSFKGLSAPGPEDGSHWKAGDLASQEAEVRKNLSAFDFVEYHRGWIPERFPDVSQKRFSFVHLDIDLYQPTLDSLVFFYERMQPGGIMLCDDYGFVTCPGARKAMDSFFAEKKEKIIHLSSGQGFIQRQA
jgi:O-methyltransferase